MRGFLSLLEAKGELHRVEKAVKARFEISAILSLRDRGAAQLFQAVDGYGMPVLGNLYVDRGRFADALACDATMLDQICLSALSSPIPPTVVDTGPVHEVVQTGAPDIGRLLPVPHWFEREAAPYITAGVVIAKDPETGRRNVSIARFRLEGGNRLMAGVAKNHHLFILAEKARSAGKDLEIAIAIGNHAAVLLGSQMYVGLGDDEYDIVGGLLQEPLELVKCKTVDIEIPAQAEISLEGRIKSGNLIEEGPVSEFPGFYVNYGPGLAVEIDCITHRHDAIYQAILPGYAAEHCLLGAIAIGATLTRDLQRMIPAVRRVVVTEGGMGRLHAVIVIHRPRLGEGKRAAMLAMGLVNLLKHIVVVDDDIDPENPREVEWSLAARFRGNEDLVVIPGVKADRCDPVHSDLTVTKIAMVATTRPGDGEPDSRSEFARPDQAVYENIKRQIHLY
ncbi:MAG TPA: UbiD family decarboxylase [Terriglobales bacterium]|nr:UbiD family decarboxylase [Terriglobales bacterium]